MDTAVQQQPRQGLEVPVSKRRLARAMLPWAALLLVVLALDVARGINTWDEAWFLRVSQRVVSGEVLYRDVFFGATPLSVYLSSGLVAALGTEVLVTKALQAAVAVGLAAVLWRLAGRLGVGRSGRAILAVGVAILPLWMTSPYTPLAMLFLALTWLAMMRWIDDADRAEGATLALVGAGVAAGLAFASKQNVGGYALVAALVVAAGRSGGIRPFARHALLVLGAFSTVVLVVLAPVVATGGFQAMLDYGFLNRGTYLRLLGSGYITGLGDLGKALVSGRVADATAHVFLLLPPAAAGALVLERLVGGRNSRAPAVWAFTAAALLVMVPPVPGVGHVVPVAAAMYVAVAYAWTGMRPRFGQSARAVTAFAAAFVALTFAGRVAPPLSGLIFGDHRLSTMPHFRGVLVDGSDQAAMLNRAAAQVQESETARPFLLSPQAGFYYLLSGLENPTPYDYPLATAFGREGIEETVAAIEAGRIREVCIEPLAGLGIDRLRAVHLERSVRATMSPVADVGFCTLYRAPA
jgi:hypothetical protein